MTNPSTKGCSLCGEEKGLSEYSPHPAGKFGLQARCKACCSRLNSERYHADLEKSRERSRLRAEADRNGPRGQEIAAAKLKWQQENQAQVAESRLRWAAANPEKERAAKDAWRKANLERFNKKGKAWKKANPEAMLRYRLKKYGLTPEAYSSMLAAQDNRCAICEGPFSKKGPCVDHHHDSGRARELLCVQCNAALGQMRERPEILEAAARYLRKHNGVLK